jgi:alpha-ketoglutarate-dependent taurine dioxygenase
MALEMRPLSPALGIEVRGLDLARALSTDVVAQLREAWADHHLLVLRDQHIDEDRQVAFACLFGPVSHRGAYMKDRMATHVSNVRPDGILGGGVLHFHSDHTFFAKPLKAICLYGIEVPAKGGETLFANAISAYRNLPDDLKRRIEGLSSVQLFDYTGDYNRRTLLDDAPADAPRCEHPLVKVDEATGERVLFVHEHTTAAIPGLDHGEVDRLMAELMTYLADPAIGYRHSWRAGDVLIWNNITLQHARTDFDPGERRTLRRVPIAVSQAEAWDATATAA